MESEVALEQLEGNALLAAATVTYAGFYTEAKRADLLAQWAEHLSGLGVPVDRDFRLHKFMLPRDQGGRFTPPDVLLDGHTRDSMLIAGLSQLCTIMIDPVSP